MIDRASGSPEMRYDDYAERFPKLVSEVQAAKWKALRFLNKLGAIRNPSSKAERDTQRHLVRLALKQRHLKLFFTFEGIKKAKALSQCPPDRVRSLAEEMDPCRPLQEEVRTFRLDKNGKIRDIEIFGPQARARQMLVAEVLKTIHHPLPFQYKLNGGVPAALEAVEKAVKAGYTHALEVDVANFFPSIRLDSLYSLLSPLPRAAVEYTVFTEGSRTSQDVRSFPQGATTLPASFTRGLRGLSQGSACSNITAELLMAQFLSRLPSSVRAVNFADNIMLLGLTKHDVEQAVVIFAQHLGAASSGSLVLKGQDNPPACLLEEDFEFLGYVGRMLLVDGEKTVSWQPASGRMEAIESEIESERSTAESLKRTIRTVEGWTGGYVCWKESDPWAALRLAQLKSKLMCMTGRIDRVQLAAEVARHWRDLGFHVLLDVILPEPSASGYGDAKELVLRRSWLLRTEEQASPGSPTANGY